MMSKNEERKIIDSLANDKTMEMKYDDLVQLLNIELSKPESEMDTQLIREILNVLEPADPDPAQMRESWQHVKENLPKRQRSTRRHVRLAHVAAAFAVVCVVLVSTVEDAGAFRWTLLQKILKPVAETFGIIIDDQTEIEPEVTEPTVYSVSDAPSELVTYATLDEVPEMYEGYMIKPKWLPEGAVFSAGSRFTSFDSEIYSLDFMNGEKWFNLNIHITTLDSAVYSCEFERNIDVPIEMEVGQRKVTLYSNAQDEFQLAFWIHENAHYVITGELTQEEIIKIIEQIE